MRSENLKVGIKEFRKDASSYLRWVEETGAQLWLTRHGRIRSAVVPFYQVELLEKLLDPSMQEHTRATQEAYDRWLEAKRAQRTVETARLATGLGAGGPVRTRRLQGMVNEGRDPWAEDPILVTPNNARWRGV